MSRENVEVVRAVFDAAARGEGASVLALYDPDVVWDNSRVRGEGLMAPGIYRGHEGLREWFRAWSEPWASLHYRPGELIDGGDRVVATATMKGRGRASGAEVEWTAFAVWTVREGKVVRVVWFPTRAGALDAAALSEQAMSQDLEKIREGFEPFNAFMRGELSTEAYVEQFFDPQLELRWHEQQTYPDAPQELRGADELAAWIEEYRSAWTDLRRKALEIIEAPGDRFVALIRLTGRGRESGVPIAIHFFEVITLREGKVRTIEYFRHRADALEAAGLSE